jgi:tRNA G46 methylase TrmB
MVSRLNISFEDFTFFDFGSGKGRALHLASEFPFKNIIGVEFSSKLHARSLRW